MQILYENETSIIVLQICSDPLMNMLRVCLTAALLVCCKYPPACKLSVMSSCVITTSYEHHITNFYTQTQTIITCMCRHSHRHTQRCDVPVFTNKIPIIETINGVEKCSCLEITLN